MRPEIFPLFGDRWNPFDHEPSLEPEENTLIVASLAALDPALDAPTTYRTLRQYLNQKSANTEVEVLAKVIERYLIWCFFIKKKSPLSVSAGDLFEYCIFKPSSALIRNKTNCKRFLNIHGCCEVNVEWRPFSRARYSIDHIRNELNAFYLYLNGCIGYVINLPLKSVRAYLYSAYSIAELLSMANRYFSIFLESGSEKDTRTCRPRFHYEKKLFLLSTCYFLRIPFFQLMSVSEYFSMSSFKFSGDKCYLHLSGDSRDLYRDVPDSYLPYLHRYRAHLDLPPIPNKFESSPIYRSRTQIRSLISSFPTYTEITLRPAEIFLRLAPYWNGEVEILEPAAPSRGKNRSERYRYRPSLDRLERFSRNFPINDSDLIYANSGCIPPPLCYFANKFDPAVMHVDSLELQSRISRAIGYGKDFEREPLIIFANYANSAAGQRSKLKVRAFEKFCLWSSLVQKKAIASMTRADAEHFYLFCGLPPLDWCIRKGNPTRFILDQEKMMLLPNPAWRPFKVNSETTIESERRAGRIIIWCDAVLQDLIADGLADRNMFTALSKGLA